MGERVYRVQACVGDTVLGMHEFEMDVCVCYNFVDHVFACT